MPSAALTHRTSSRIAWRAAFIALALCALTVSSYVSVPLYPVPVTMQTLVVLLIGTALGPRTGAATVLAWLSLAAVGVPVLADGKSGLLAFSGPTAGYLAAFPIAAFLAGWLTRASHRFSLRSAGFLALHGLILLMGWAWLSTLIGPQTALSAGVAPFLIGAVLKSILAAAILLAVPRLGGARLRA